MNKYSQDATLVSHHEQGRRKHPNLLSCIVALGLCAVLVVVPMGGYYFTTSTGEARPLVVIKAPHNGDLVEAGQSITIQAVASDVHNIVRVELWIDGELLEAENSSVPDGISSFPLLTDWQASSGGTHIIIVRAFNSLGGRAYSAVRVQVSEVADSHNDGVRNENDPACTRRNINCHPPRHGIVKLELFPFAP